MTVTIHCGCGERLGQIGPSTRSGNPRPVWRIEPGWGWSDMHLGRGILERRDETFRAERRLYSQIAGGRIPEGIAVLRECDLPIVVRCPRCRKPRWVAPDAALAAAGSPGRR